MDLFGFKKRRLQRERDAQIRADALNRASKIMQRPNTTTPPAPPRRRRPEADAPDYIQAAGLYPHSSRAMEVDYNHAAWAQPSSSSSDDSGSRSSSSDSFGAAGSGLNLGGSGGSSYDSGSSSSSSYDSGSSSSSSDSGGY